MPRITGFSTAFPLSPPVTLSHRLKISWMINAKGKRGDGQVDAGHAQCRQPDEDARRRRDRTRQCDRDKPGQPQILDEVDMRIGANAEEGGVAEAYEAGKA